MQLSSSPQLNRRQQGSKLGKRTSAPTAQKLSVKPATEARAASKTDIKKGTIFSVCDNVLVIHLSCVDLTVAFVTAVLLDNPLHTERSRGLRARQCFESN